MKRTVFILILLCFSYGPAAAWGFFAHKLINRMAVFTLPPEMIGFYKYYISFLSENAVNPDKRRYAVDGEAPRHYVDIDHFDDLYGDSAVYKMPRFWKEAIKAHSEDTLMAYGIAPWNVQNFKMRLTQAFRQKDVGRILRLSADIGHYIADSNVPLHTTVNYNGQLTNQVGIHAFWESRLPELYSGKYNFFVGKAEYIENTQFKAWEAVTRAHEALDSVLLFEKQLSEEITLDKKYTLEERNTITIRTYSRPFCQTYHERLNGQVERRMRAAIKMIGDFWMTAWVDAGQPDLKLLMDEKYQRQLEKELEKELKELKKKKIKTRSHEGVAMLNQHEHKGCCPDDTWMAMYFRFRRLDNKVGNKEPTPSTN